MTDFAAIRKEFPILDQEIHGHPLVYLDSAATSQKPQCVIDAESDFYRTINAGVHRGAHELAARSTIEKRHEPSVHSVPYTVFNFLPRCPFLHPVTLVPSP